MIRLVQLLNEKNHFLEKFYTLNESQMSRMRAGQFDEIERFYNQREDLLKIIKYIDAEVQKAHGLHKEVSGSFSDEQKTAIRQALRVKESFVQRILDQDLVILSLIDEAKSQIIREMKEVTKSRKALTGYKASVA